MGMSIKQASIGISNVVVSAISIVHVFGGVFRQLRHFATSVGDDTEEDICANSCCYGGQDGCRRKGFQENVANGLPDIAIVFGHSRLFRRMALALIIDIK